MIKALILAALLSLPILADAKCGLPTTKRHHAVAQRFMRQTGYPNGRPGFVVDHIVPLCKGGPDITTNMQWQTIADAKAKDKWECHCDR
jgi:hypothetical protein